MEIFWPLERRYVSVEEQQASCRRRGLGCRWGFFFREGDAFQRWAFSKRGEDILTRRVEGKNEGREKLEAAEIF